MAGERRRERAAGAVDRGNQPESVVCQDRDVDRMVRTLQEHEEATYCSAQVMLGAYERRRFQTELINEMPLYPTERLLWDEHQIPSVNYTGAQHLVIPLPCTLMWSRVSQMQHQAARSHLCFGLACGMTPGGMFAEQLVIGS